MFLLLLGFGLVAHGFGNWFSPPADSLAQGMFWCKKLNKINNKICLCPPLYRDLLRPRFFNNLSVAARRRAFGASLGVVQLVHLSPRQRRGFLDGLLSRDSVGAQPA
jgi:hypothetical protein